MTESPQFGSRLGDVNYKRFFELSTETFSIYHNKIQQADSTDLIVQFWARLAYFAESSSWSIRMLTSWEASLPAVALARVRLEQVIVCSYLIHENTDVGLGPYLKHLQIERYWNSKHAERNPVLKKILGEIMERDAPGLQKVRERILENFSFESMNRKWTKLDLLSMAKKRDSITKKLPNVSHLPLELDYAAVYGSFSSLVHSGIAAFSDDYLNCRIESSKIILTPKPVLSDHVVMLLAKWDILQMFEILTKMQIACEEELRALHERFLAYRNEHFGMEEEDTAS